MGGIAPEVCRQQASSQAVYDSRMNLSSSSSNFISLRCIAIALCCLLSGLPSAAHGWGNEGHRLSGYIANALLTEQTRIRLNAITGTSDLAQLATVLDDERDALEERIPGSNRWHYENRQVCPRTPASRAECPQGQCITRQIERFTKILRDARSTRDHQIDAVHGLAHLLGDLHQPLHLSDKNDRGGNELKVRLPTERKARNLHEVWDTRLVRQNLRRRDERRYALALLKKFSAQQTQWSRGNTQNWAHETHLLSVEHAYRALPGFTCGAHDNAVLTLPDSYVSQARLLIDEQLVKSGVRLAAVLNLVLASP
jgi:hypothetical protein